MNYRVKQGIAALLIAAVIAVVAQGVETDLTGAAGLVALIGVVLIVWGLLVPARD